MCFRRFVLRRFSCERAGDPTTVSSMSTSAAQSFTCIAAFAYDSMLYDTLYTPGAAQFGAAGTSGRKQQGSQAIASASHWHPSDRKRSQAARASQEEGEAELPLIISLLLASRKYQAVAESRTRGNSELSSLFPSPSSVG